MSISALVKIGRRTLGTWWFWAFVLLVVPNCALNSRGLCAEGDPECNGTPDPCDGQKECTPTALFEPGDPAKDTIICEFPAPLNEGDLGCATAQEVANGDGFPLTEAAVRLASGESKAFAFDYSAAALASCNGLPRKITYLAGKFPDGANVCLNCGQKIGGGNKYPDPTAACVAKCEDLINLGPGPFPADVAAYCQQNARTAVNYDKNICYPDTCTSGGTFIPGFLDPRRVPEKLKWVDLLGTTDNGGNTLTRTAATTGNTVADFNAGAASAQVIKSGDAWVEFEASSNNTGQVLSLRTSCADPFNCPDSDPGLFDMGWALVLYNDGQVSVNEFVPTTQAFGPFGPYTPGERYRVRAKDNHDGTATISYSRIIGTCDAGTVCSEDVFYTSLTPAAYPLRVDASIREQGATLANVKIMRILEQ